MHHPDQADESAIICFTLCARGTGWKGRSGGGATGYQGGWEKCADSRHVPDDADFCDDVDPLEEPPEEKGDEEVKEEKRGGEEGGLVGCIPARSGVVMGWSAFSERV